MAKKLYLFITWEDVEPEVCGPYATERKRSAAARRFREDNGPDHGIFKLDVNTERVTTDAYSGGFLDVKG